MKIQKRQMEAYDYRGHLILLMPSGLALVFGPHPLNTDGLDAPRPILGEVQGLEPAKALVDTLLTPKKVPTSSGTSAYRRHLLVPMENLTTLVYRSTLQGEGRARLNEFYGEGSFDAAVRWIDSLYKSSPAWPNTAPEPSETPDFVKDDLRRGPNIYVLEHSTRGCFVGMGDGPDGFTRKPKFRWSIPRSDRSIVRYRTREDAATAAAGLAVKGCYIVALYKDSKP